MQVILSKDIIGIKRDSCEPILHAKEGDILDVILRNKTHFICDSLYFPNTAIVVFPSQCEEVLTEKDIEDEFAPEKYYNVYEEPEIESRIDKAKKILNDDISDPEEFEY